MVDIGSRTQGVDAFQLREYAYPNLNDDLVRMVYLCHGVAQGNVSQKQTAHALLKGIEDFYGPRKDFIEATDIPTYDPLKGILSLLPLFREQFESLRTGQREQVSFLEYMAMSMIRSNVTYNQSITVLDAANDN